jgi:transposase-like protein
MRAPGATAAGIAKAFGVSQATVYRACRERDMRLGSGGTVGLLARRARIHRQIVAALRRGATKAEAARRIGVSVNTVTGACRAHGVRAIRPDNVLRTKSMRARAQLAARLSPSGQRPPGARKSPAGSSTAMVTKLLLKTRLSYSEIGEVCGVSRQRVQQVFAALRAAGSR